MSTKDQEPKRRSTPLNKGFLKRVGSGQVRKRDAAEYAFYVYNYALCVQVARSTLSFRQFGQACSPQPYFNPITGGL
ncbi:MAG: hypothetical protein QOJ42_7365 [Acidobacteriaceae bacterium]|nr:hypothetical protein [Acidobacteriaceae bacterium]